MGYNEQSQTMDRRSGFAAQKGALMNANVYRSAQSDTSKGGCQYDEKHKNNIKKIKNI